jgi:hypothetical protein
MMAIGVRKASSSTTTSSGLRACRIMYAAAARCAVCSITGSGSRMTSDTTCLVAVAGLWGFTIATSNVLLSTASRPTRPRGIVRSRRDQGCRVRSWSSRRP